ncbi:MAG: tetratricopeptide repeat protein [Thermomicrobiales bacterium]
MSNGHQTNRYLQMLTEAWQASAEERWAAAAPLWEAVVASNPVDGGFWHALGNAQFGNGDYRSALGAYYEAFDLGSGFPFDIAYRIAECHASTVSLTKRSSGSSVRSISATGTSKGKSRRDLRSAP